MGHYIWFSQIGSHINVVHSPTDWFFSTAIIWITTHNVMIEVGLVGVQDPNCYK